MEVSLSQRAKALFFVCLNLFAATSIVFLNKAVLSVFGFHYVFALAFVHALFTAAGMWAFGWCGMFELKRLPRSTTLPLATAFVGYIVSWNMSLRVNPVGFYQLSKIMITPVVMAFELGLNGKWPSKAEQAAIAILCVGVFFATVTDPHLQANLYGLVIGMGAVVFTAVYQVCLSYSPCDD